MLVATVVFVLARYLPIIANLFMNVTERRAPDEHGWVEGETVSFESADGLRLEGTLTPAPEDNPTAPVVVFCHEYTANRHSAKKYAGFLQEAGFRIFTFDFRGHGDSEQPSGYVPRQWATEHELCDLRSALRYLRTRSDTNGASVGLFGVSRGAATAIAVASDGFRVSAVVTDGAFSTPHTLHSYMRRWRPIFVDARLLMYSEHDLILGTIRWMAMKLAEHRMGVRFVSLIPALRRLRVPCLFVHGERDGYIDMDQAKLLYGYAGGRKELWVVPDADHNRAVDADPTEYRRRVMSFFRAALGVTERAVTSPLRHSSLSYEG